MPDASWVINQDSFKKNGQHWKSSLRIKLGWKKYE